MTVSRSVGLQFVTDVNIEDFTAQNRNQIQKDIQNIQAI